MVARPLIAFVSLILTAGAILLLFLVILAGGHESNPLNQIYFLQADTTGVAGAMPTSRWTLYNICGVMNGRNANCGKAKAAYPFDPAYDNFHTTTGLEAFVGTHKKFYYLSRFMFAFYLITLFFAVCAFFTGFLAMCARLGGAITGFMASIALFWASATASLMTACFVIGRNDFRKSGHTAQIGKYAFAFTWAAMACLLLSTIMFCTTAAIGRKDTSKSTYAKNTGGKSFFGRNRTARSRGSFIDTESQSRVVKDEYS
ncbi:MAG: hypothetical protein M1827_007306 [Pycnora praestabilis]|nr:MAG: hypothetical protein M1827_007306 [Pycnora praestabilis]